MGIRHLARERALQLLYALEYAPAQADPAEVERRFLLADKPLRRGWGPFARALTHQTWARRADLDRAIRPTLKNWRLERLPLVEHICLRLALCEMAYFPEVPLRVTINEYIDLTRQFGDEESPVYVNAVLDTLAKAFPHKDFQTHGEGRGESGMDPDATLAALSEEVSAAPPPAAESAPDASS